MSLPDSLLVAINGRRVGTVHRDGSKLRFVYNDQWRSSEPGMPLSLSMPLVEKRHPHRLIGNWMGNLLPDNYTTLKKIGEEHGVSPNNPYAMLWKIGLDCPGAVQFVVSEEFKNLSTSGSIKRLGITEIEQRLFELRTQSSQGRQPREGQFSLPGAQPKTALCLVDGEWGIPSGRIPTTHILKPPTTGFDGHLQNEHFCLSLARRLGLSVAESRIMQFGKETAIVVERYDRVLTGPHPMRLHQEDLCQALGIHSRMKYQADGGPGIETIMKLLGRTTKPDLDRRDFMRAVIFGFLIGGTDGHAKNYSILIAPGQYRLAPLYDIASFLPYAGRWSEVKMPMSIGGTDHYDRVHPRHVARMASATGMSEEEILETIRSFAENIPKHAAGLRTEIAGTGADHPVLDALVRQLTAWCHVVSERFKDRPELKNNAEHGVEEYEDEQEEGSTPSALHLS